MGYGEDYRYAHDFEDAFVPGESYVPEAIADKRFYHPVDRGLESKIQEKLKYLRQLNDSSEFKRYPRDE